MGGKIVSNNKVCKGLTIKPINNKIINKNRGQPSRQASVDGLLLKSMKRLFKWSSKFQMKSIKINFEELVELESIIAEWNPKTDNLQLVEEWMER
jgi:hypothetical protein